LRPFLYLEKCLTCYGCFNRALRFHKIVKVMSINAKQLVADTTVAHASLTTIAK
jgi:hypothetical protein